MDNKKALETLAITNVVRRMGQIMDIEGMETIFPRAIWFSISPNRKERRLRGRRRVRNNSQLTKQTPHRDYEKVLFFKHNTAFAERVEERKALLYNK